jgi:hypothetical protein
MPSDCLKEQVCVILRCGCEWTYEQRHVSGLVNGRGRLRRRIVPSAERNENQLQP